MTQETQAAPEIMIRLWWEGPFVPVIPKDPDTGEWGKKSAYAFYPADALLSGKTEAAASFLDDPNKDYGVYQIYGPHAAYGTEVLLYIGRAGEDAVASSDRTFASRLRDHVEAYGTDIKIYVGRLTGETRPDDETWAEHIRLAEKLLIFSSQPASNAKSVASLWSGPEGETLRTRRVRVRNYGSSKMLAMDYSSDALHGHSTFKEECLNWYSYKEGE